MDGVTRAMYRASVLDRQQARPERLEPGVVYEITIDLGEIRATIPAGSRLQVDVVSSNFPRRARNTNSGNALMARDTDADIRVVANTVHHGAEAPSYVELTVLF